MKTLLAQLVRGMFNRLGLDIVRYHSPESAGYYPPDFDPQTIATIQAVRPFTMTSPERIFSLCQAVKYVVEQDIPGAIVECGVWRGGSMMAVARTLLELGIEDRDLYLFDTFEGMPPPTEKDVSYRGTKATELLKKSDKTEADSVWCYAPLAGVQQALAQVGYNPEKIHFVPGKVEETLPHQAPETIALLRLDTDWYESTRHELIHLFPRLSPNGVLIIDDYGYWQGARQAVDEYLQQNQIKLLLNRIDLTGRIAIVPGKT